MVAMIRLTSTDGTAITLLTDFIVGLLDFQESDRQTDVYLSNGNIFPVKEAPDEIIRRMTG